MTGIPFDNAEPAQRLGPAALKVPILIVDDDPLSREVVVGYLRNSGFTNIDVAKDGAVALEKVRATCPALVVLDVMMPVMDGFEVCAALRAEEKFQDLPILALTALEGIRERVEIFRAGASDVVIKPVHPLELIARASVHIERRLLMLGRRRALERIERELSAARAMQLALLPDTRNETRLLPHDFELASQFSTSSELGGDFWGLLNFADGRIGVYVADFAGHGVMAALNTIRLHTLVQGLRVLPADPGEFLNLLNQHLVPLLPVGQFATMICVCFDQAGESTRYAAAGSPAPLLRVNGKGWRMLDSAGVPLGVTADAVYPTRTAPFAAGDLLFLYSDAFAETPLAAGGRLGEIGVKTLVETAPSHSAESFLDDVVGRFGSAIVEHPSDDLTCLAIRRRSE